MNASSGKVRIRVDGEPVEAPAGTTLAAALIGSGRAAFRASVTGMPRGPVCGMGICFECCVAVDGRPHVRSCLTVCRDGMDVRLRGESP